MAKLRNPARSLLILEMLICFLPCSLVLLAGVIMFPKELLLLFQRPLGFEGPLRLVLSVPCGLIGLWALYRVVSALLDNKQGIEQPARTLGCVVLGLLPLILEFAARTPRVPLSARIGTRERLQDFSRQTSSIGSL